MTEYHITVNDIESFFTIIALIVGGIWAYLLFVKNREKYPKAIIKHEIQKVEFENEVLVRLTVQIENIGKVILPIISGEVWLQHLLPYDEGVKEALKNFQKNENKQKLDIGWPIIEKRVLKYDNKNGYELEPGEADRFDFDFIVKKEVKAIQFYTHIKNVEKIDKGWNYTIIHKL